MPLAFEWNPRKAESNLRKHGVSFDEAVSVFGDPLAAIFADDSHSSDEPREIIVGYSVTARLLLVSFAEVRKDKLRIISARQATPGERRAHEEYVSG